MVFGRGAPLTPFAAVPWGFRTGFLARKGLAAGRFRRKGAGPPFGVVDGGPDGGPPPAGEALIVLVACDLVRKIAALYEAAGMQCAAEFVVV